MLDVIVPNIRNTAELVQEISAACREQDSGAQQIGRAIQQLDKVIQQNACAADEMSATAEEMTTQAEQLQETVSVFKVKKDSVFNANTNQEFDQEVLADFSGESRQKTAPVLKIHTSLPKDELDDQFVQY